MLEGEVVRDLKPIIGYVHTGIEKTAEDKAYWKAIPVVERMDYLAYFFNAYAFCGAVETLIGLEIPKRAQYLRVIHLELNRIMSHLVWLGTSALDLGAISMFWYCFRDRETILDLFEMSTGQRMHTRYIQVGGVFEDIPDGLRRTSCKQFCRRDARPASTSTRDLLENNEIVIQRLRDVAIVDEETLLALGVTGPLLRATGNAVGPAQGARRTAATTTSSSRSRSARSATTTTATASAWRRSRSRCGSSSRRSTGLPEGPYITEDRKYALPPRHELATSMEALIHHFKLVTEGFRVPPGEVYFPIESPRGELGCFVRSDGSAKPARVHMRDPSLREPAGAQADVRGRLHRGLHRHARDARPGARGHRPVSGDELAPARPPLRARLARPRLGRGRRPRAGPRGRPRPRDDAGARRAAALTIEDYMSRYPDRRSASIPALRAAQKHHGWLSPTAVEQVAAVMRLTPGYLIAVATFYDMFETAPVGEHTIYVCTNISCSLRGADRRLRGDARRRRRRPALQRARVRVPRRLRHRADGLGQPDLRRPADRRGLRDAHRSSCATASEPLPGQAARASARSPGDVLERRS